MRWGARLILAALLATSALGPGLASGQGASAQGNAYGRQIIEACGGPFGEGVSILRALQRQGFQHPVANPVGARRFVESGALALHCPAE